MQQINERAIIVVQEARHLAAILDDTVNMVILKRVPSRMTGAAFGALAETMKGEFRSLVSKDSFATEMAEFLAQFGTSAIQRDIIINEIGQLFAIMRSLSNDRKAQVVFGAVDSDHCKLFHADHNYLRLVCTFFGKGTEFLLNEDVNRAGLGTGTNAGHIPGRPIQSLGTYDIGIMKGELFPGNRGNGLVHRSPPILPGDSHRLFLAIDARAGFSARAMPTASRNRFLPVPTELKITRQLFPIKKRFWRLRDAKEGLFCQQVKARYEQSRQALAQHQASLRDSE